MWQQDRTPNQGREVEDGGLPDTSLESERELLVLTDTEPCGSSSNEEPFGVLEVPRSTELSRQFLEISRNLFD